MPEEVKALTAEEMLQLINRYKRLADSREVDLTDLEEAYRKRSLHAAKLQSTIDARELRIAELEAKVRDVEQGNRMARDLLAQAERDSARDLAFRECAEAICPGCRRSFPRCDPMNATQIGCKAFVLHRANPGAFEEKKR